MATLQVYSDTFEHALDLAPTPNFWFATTKQTRHASYRGRELKMQHYRPNFARLRCYQVLVAILPCKILLRTVSLFLAVYLICKYSQQEQTEIRDKELIKAQSLLENLQVLQPAD